MFPRRHALTLRALPPMPGRPCLFWRTALLAALLSVPAPARPSGTPAAAESALAASTAAYLRGNYEEAARPLEAVTLGKNATAGALQVTLLIRLSSIYSAQGRYKEAESLLLSALGQSEKSYGSKDPISGTISLMLGNTLQEQGRYAESEAQYRKALQVLQAEYGVDHPAVAECLSGLAELSRLLANKEEAQRRYWQAYMVSSYLYGGESSKVGDLLTRLAKVYLSQGNEKEAENLFARALKIGGRPLQANGQWGRLDDRDLLLSLPSEREYSATQGKITYKIKESEHPQFARYFDSLSELYSAAGEYSKAENAFRRSIAVRERAFGRDHPEVAAARGGLALVLEQRGDYAGALDLTRTAAATLAKRILSYPVADAHYAQGERRRWRPTFLQLLAMLNDQSTRVRSSLEESFSAMQYAIPVNAAEAAAAMVRMLADGNARLAARILSDVGAEEPMTISEVQDLLESDEAMVIYVQGNDESYVGLVGKRSADIRVARGGPKVDPLAVFSPELAALRKVILVADRVLENSPFITLPSVASLRAFRAQRDNKR